MLRVRLVEASLRTVLCRFTQTQRGQTRAERQHLHHLLLAAPVWLQLFGPPLLHGGAMAPLPQPLSKP